MAWSDRRTQLATALRGRSLSRLRGSLLRYEATRTLGEQRARQEEERRGQEMARAHFWSATGSFILALLLIGVAVLCPWPFATPVRLSVTTSYFTAETSDSFERNDDVVTFRGAITMEGNGPQTVSQDQSIVCQGAMQSTLLVTDGRVTRLTVEPDSTLELIRRAVGDTQIRIIGGGTPDLEGFAARATLSMRVNLLDLSQVGCAGPAQSGTGETRSPQATGTAASTIRKILVGTQPVEAGDGTNSPGKSAQLGNISLAVKAKPKQSFELTFYGPTQMSLSNIGLKSMEFEQLSGGTPDFPYSGIRAGQIEFLETGDKRTLYQGYRLRLSEPRVDWLSLTAPNQFQLEAIIRASDTEVAFPGGTFESLQPRIFDFILAQGKAKAAWGMVTALAAVLAAVYSTLLGVLGRTRRR